MEKSLDIIYEFLLMQCEFYDLSKKQVVLLQKIIDDIFELRKEVENEKYI